jgi:hypothetical protein
MSAASKRWWYRARHGIPAQWRHPRGPASVPWKAARRYLEDNPPPVQRQVVLTALGLAVVDDDRHL